MIVTEGTVTVKFGRESRNWSSDQDINKLFLRNVQNYLNDWLRHRGNMFLNEIYDELGLPRTSQGATDGWLLSRGSTIEFSPSEPDEDGAILLTLKTHGIIYDKIEEGS